jgi:hypothetical protein
MRKCVLAVGIVFTTRGLVASDGVTPAVFVAPAVSVAPVQQCYTALPIDQAVVPVMYPSTADELPPPSASPALDGAAPVLASGAAADVIIPPAGYPSSAWSPPAVEPPCPCESIYRTTAWQLGAEFIPTNSHLTAGQFGPWPDDGALALRFHLGYEDETGLGVRGRWWLFGQSVEAPVDDVDLAATTISLDFSKRLFIEETELVLGAGPAGGALSFQLSNNEESEFAGGGISIFAEVWHPLLRFERIDLGSVARARYSLLLGEWEDDTGFVIPSTDDDNMSVAELAWGLELRSRFGFKQDKHWYLAILVEHQNWDSALMTRFMDSSVGFTGTSFALGLAY